MAYATTELSAGGGVVTVVFKEERCALSFCERLRVFSIAESLGGVESLCCHPAIMTLGKVPPATREARGVTGGVVRLSVGIEEIQDLLGDVDQALSGA